MRRHLVNLVTAVSLVLAIAGAAVWARSYVAADWMVIQSGRRQTDLYSDCGSYTVRTLLHPIYFGHEWAWGSDEFDLSGGAVTRGLTQFQWTTHKPVGALYIVVPQWTVPAAFGILPAVRFVRWRRQWRAATLRGFPLAHEGESV